MTVIANGRSYAAADYPIPAEPSVFEKKRDGREILRLTVYARHEDAARDFSDGAPLLRRTDDGTMYDKSAFSVAGDIVDHRDGRITVYMGKHTEAEKEKARSAELEQAVRIWKNAAEEAETKLKALRREAKVNAELREVLERIGI